MQIKHNLARLLIFITLPFLFSSCANTNLIESWSDPTFQGPPLKKILIIGVIKNEERRHTFEEKFSNLITTDNRTGIASYTLLPDLEGADTKEKVRAVIKKTGVDGVMVVTTYGVFEQDRVTRGTIDYIPNTGLGYGMYGYYNMTHAFIYTQGHTVTDTLLNIDTKLFSVATEKVLWSGKTETFNPTSAKEVTQELETLIINKMTKSGIIQD